MRVLSFDISASPGVAVLEFKDGKPNLIAVDHVETKATHSDAQRYVYIQSFVTQFIHDNGVYDEVVREKFIRGGSKRGTQLVFGAWASVDRALATYGYEIPDDNEIVASQVKNRVAGKGNASKEELAEAVINVLGEDKRELFYTPRGRLLDDRADAVAIGMAWAIDNEYMEVDKV